MNVNEYNKCVKLYSDHLYRFMLKNVNDSERAKDLVQSAYEVLWIKREEVEEEKAKSFLFTVGYRKMIDDIRKSEKMKYVENIQENMAEQVHTKQANLKRILHEALDKLPDIQKQLVLLKDYEGYNYEELAKITGLNIGQVKITLFRARTSLKESLISVKTHI